MEAFDATPRKGWTKQGQQAFDADPRNAAALDGLSLEEMLAMMERPELFTARREGMETK